LIVQSNVAPAGTDVKVIPVVEPEQSVSLVGVAVTVGLEPIVITTSDGIPGQPLADGVTV
jgi:hypothetical protein